MLIKKYVIVVIMLLASSYALGQGVELWDGVVSGSPDTVNVAKTKVYNFGGGEFLMSLYDRDQGTIYGLNFGSIENFPFDSLTKRNDLLDSVKIDFIERFGPLALDNSGGYLPFLGHNQNFTLYAWRKGDKVIMISLYGRRDATNVIRIEIFDSKML